MIRNLVTIIIINCVNYSYCKVEINYYSSNSSSDISIQNKEKIDNIWNIISSADFNSNSRYPETDSLINGSEIILNVDQKDLPCVLCNHLIPDRSNFFNSLRNCDCHVDKDKGQNQEILRLVDEVSSPFIDLEVKDCIKPLFKENEMTCVCQNCKNGGSKLLEKEIPTLSANFRRMTEGSSPFIDIQVKDCNNPAFIQNEMTCTCKNCRNTRKNWPETEIPILTTNFRRNAEVVSPFIIVKEYSDPLFNQNEMVCACQNCKNAVNGIPDKETQMPTTKLRRISELPSSFIDIEVKDCGDPLFKQNEMICICNKCRNAESNLFEKDSSANLRHTPEITYNVDDSQDNISLILDRGVQFGLTKNVKSKAINPLLEFITEESNGNEYLTIIDENTMRKSRTKRETSNQNNRNFVSQPFNRFSSQGNNMAVPRQYPIHIQPSSFPSNVMMGGIQRNFPTMSGNTFSMQSQPQMRPAQTSFPYAFPSSPCQMPQMPQMPMFPGMSQIPGLPQLPGMPFNPTMQNFAPQAQPNSQSRHSSNPKIKVENGIEVSPKESDEVIRIVIEPNKKEESITPQPRTHFKSMNPDSSAEIQFVVLSNGDVVPVSNMEKKINRKLKEKSTNQKITLNRHKIDTSSERRRKIQSKMEKTATAKHFDESTEEVSGESQSLEKLKNEHPSYSKAKKPNQKRVLRTLSLPETDEIAKEHSTRKRNVRKL